MKGQRPLIFYSNGHHTWLWDDCRAAPREVRGFYTREELQLAIQRRDLQVDPRRLKVDPAHIERPYLVHHIRAMADSLAPVRRRRVPPLAPGTGNTPRLSP